MAPVQTASATTGAAYAASLTATLGQAATAGNLLIAVGNSNATLTGPTGFGLAVSRVASNGSYIWYKIAAGGETSFTITPSVSNTAVLAVAEYAGVAATPLDVTSSTARSGSLSNTQATGTTAATAQASELVIVAACPHSFAAASPPNTPTWLTATERVTPTPTSYGTSTNNVALFVGDYTTVATGAQSDTCTWTNNSNDATGLIATFKLAQALTRSLADSIAISDTLAANVALPRALADSVPISDALTARVSYARALADSLAISDTLTYTTGKDVQLSHPRHLGPGWSPPRHLGAGWAPPRHL